MSMRDLHVISGVGGAPKWSFRSNRRETRKDAVPGPGAYGVNEDVGVRFNKAPGYSWGNQAKGFVPKGSNVGPGSYDPVTEGSRPSSQRGYGARAPRHIVTSDRMMKSYQPGPGSYNVPTAFGAPNQTTGNPYGASAPSYSAGAKRTSINKSNVPGPGAYNPSDNSSSNHAHHGISLNKQLGNQFSRSARTLGWQRDTPGPGAYDAATKTDAVKPKSAQYTMRGARTQMKRDDTPGPGAHDANYSMFV